MPRFHCPLPLATGASLALPSGAARHVQVLRMQPGDALTLFDGQGGEYAATIERMGRSEVQVLVGSHLAVEREAPREIHLAVGMPANERMDWLVEKATELGVASLQPLNTARTVLKLKGERADRKQAHWQGIAAAACEQCGRNRVPVVHAPMDLEDWLQRSRLGTQPLVLSLREDTRALRETVAPGTVPLVFLSGPEGGLSAAEEEAALKAGFAPVTLGNRVLRAETAAVAVLAALQT